MLTNLSLNKCHYKASKSTQHLHDRCDAIKKFKQKDAAYLLTLNSLAEISRASKLLYLPPSAFPLEASPTRAGASFSPVKASNYEHASCICDCSTSIRSIKFDVLPHMQCWRKGFTLVLKGKRVKKWTKQLIMAIIGR